jgi:hypothetical protein
MHAIETEGGRGFARPLDACKEDDISAFLRAPSCAQ